MKINKKLSMHLYAWVTVILWALGYVLTRIAVAHFTPEGMAFLRYFIAAISLSTYALIKKMRLPALRDVPLFLFGGAVGFAVYVYAINTGSRTLTASVVSFIVSASPVITALLARIVLRERIGLIGWLSVACAFSGVGVMTFYSGGFAFGSGMPWICSAAVLISIYNIFQRKMLARYDPLEITTYCIVSGALLLSVFAPGAFPQLADATPAQIVSIVVLGVFVAGVAYLCWAYALSKADKTGEVTNYMFLTPILTTFLGFIMIGESPHPSAYIGGGLVLLGVLLMNMRNAGKGRRWKGEKIK